ncbi:MAG: spore maturation protein [Ruminococcaceae bacterium]|nr:spore maturation protein [Oscillospiraceae bacterium]
MIETLSALSMPLITALVGCVMLFGKRNYFEAFTKGATEGLQTAIRLLPTLVGLMVAISMLGASGAVARLCVWLSPIANAIGLPADLLPLLLTRPFSGSASTAAYSALLDAVGADSFTGLCASVILATSDTVVYVITVYFSSVGIRRTRYAFPVAFAVMLFCIFFSCFLCRTRLF